MGGLASPMAARQSLKLWGQSGRVKTAPNRGGGLVWFKLVDGGQRGMEDLFCFRGPSSACWTLCSFCHNCLVFVHFFQKMQISSSTKSLFTSHIYDPGEIFCNLGLRARLVPTVSTLLEQSILAAIADDNWRIPRIYSEDVNLATVIHTNIIVYIFFRVSLPRRAPSCWHGSTISLQRLRSICSLT